jgi:hypothetical protein
MSNDAIELFKPLSKYGKELEHLQGTFDLSNDVIELFKPLSKFTYQLEAL